MNERIRDLVLKAQTQAAKETIQNSFSYEGKVFEKFAELIARECASICELNGQSYTHSFTPAKARLAESTSNHCGLMIKKHFGVKE